MERLTKEQIESVFNNKMFLLPRAVGKKMSAQMIDELLEYKTIEADLGIDLLTLFKVLKYGIFDKQGKYYCPHLEYIDDEHRKEWILIEEQGDYRPDIWFSFKDYGKTWSLSKEDLENENKD